MNLDDFECEIDKKILERGYDYYMDGNIVGCKKEDDETYHFDIEGSNDYEVIVKLQGNYEITYSYCDCPYDYGPVCKHEAAAYYYLRDNMITYENNNPDQIMIEVSKKKSNEKNNIDKILKSLTKDKLIGIIKECVNEYDGLENKIMMKYAPAENEKDELKNFKKFIKSINNKYSGRYGFIDYYNAGRYSSEISCALDKVNNTYKYDVMLGFEMAKILFLELIKSVQDSDDSNGYIYDVVYETLQVIDDIAARSTLEDEKTQKKLFDKLISLSQNEKINECVYHTCDILKSCMHFCYVNERYEKLKSEIKERMDQEKSRDYGEYNAEKLSCLLFEVISKFGTEEEKEKCMEDNLEFTSFREEVIKKYIEDEKYDEALKLAFEGEEKDKDNSRMQDIWKKFRYEIYKKRAQTDEIDKVGTELLLRGNYNCYEDLKKIHKDDFKEFYERIINKLRDDENIYVAVPCYLSIIKKEKDSKEILHFLKKHKSYIEEYIEYAAQDYKEEAEELFRKYIYEESKASTNRSKYRGVCYKIKNYRKIFGPQKTAEIVEDLISKYPRRPAFVDELENLQ